MKILVTGGAGFIGSALVRHIILNTQDEVVNVDCLTYAGNLQSLRSVDLNPRYQFEQVDICDASSIARILNQYQPDVVMNLAAESHVDRSIDTPAAFIQTNLVGAFVLLEQCLAYYQTLSPERKQTFRFHQISTEEVYGDLGIEVEGKGSEQLFTEATPYAPSSPYSATKAGADHLVRAWQRTYGLPTLITTCSNNYGPFQFPEKLIPRMIINALAGEALPLYGDGSQVRDWLHVDDHARALYAVVTRGQVGETYNIGGHNQQSNLQVVEALCALLDRLSPAPSGASYRQLITFVSDRPGHDQRYAVDASKVMTALNWTPQESFATGLEQTVRWYLANTDWWQSVLSGGCLLGR